jgi:stage II sporulation protein D
MRIPKRRRSFAWGLRYRPVRRGTGAAVDRNAVLRIAACALLFVMLMGLISFFLNPPKPSPKAVNILVYNHRTKSTQTMDLEAYMLCVLAGEMPPGYEPEALKAQAVAARTYAYRKMRTNRCGRGGADVCTDSGHCQAYCDETARRERWGENFAQNEAKLKKAVEETRGQIMLYDGKPIDAMYHSSSGGRTEDAKNVYGNNVPYLIGVQSPGEEGAPRFSTTVSVSKTAFVAALKGKDKSISCTAKTLEKSIAEPVRFPSGRVSTVRIGGTTFTGKEIRKLFDLDSTVFTIAIKGESVYLSSKGYGHGVGMSQVGANAMAKANHGFREILLHYYTGIVIATL